MLQAATSGLGATMQDGGEKVSSLGDMLSSEQYSQVLESLVPDQSDT